MAELLDLPERPSSRLTSSALHKFIRRANATQVVDGYRDLATERAASRWLQPKNRYRPGESRTVARGSVNPRLREYMSASSVLHCFDAWSYLGRALAAHASGDGPAALHLGYYAELRAALALLAAQGVAVFNTRQAVIDSMGRAQSREGEGTHKFTWRALEAWGAERRSGELLGRIIRVSSVDLDQWVSYFAGGAVSIAPLAEDIVRGWGLDLRLFAEDRELRNTVSYEPTELLGGDVMTPLGSSRLVRALWRLCLPTGADAFGRLDLHLLRRSLQYVRLALGLGDDAAYETRVRATVAKVATTLSGGQQTELGDFLLGTTDDEPLQAAAVAPPATAPGVPTDASVISRGLLLLRLATGAVNELITRGSGPGQLDFWWPRWASERAVWSLGDDTTGRVANLVGEVDDAINEFATWESRPESPTTDRSGWLVQVPSALWTLVGTERIPLWSLAL